MQPVILSLGSVNADMQVHVERAPEPGRTLPATGFVRRAGGKAANAALLARRLGHPARLLARVGAAEDGLREQALGPLRAAGVDLGAVTLAPGETTGVAMIAVLPDGRKAILLAGNANEAWGEAETEGAAAAVARAPAGSVLVADWEVPAPAVARAVAAARGRGLRVVLDPSPPARVEREVLGGAGAATPNPAEAEVLTGIAVDGPEAAGEAARRLLRLGVALPCVKLAQGGCVAAHAGRLTLLRPPPVRAVDATGAGDAFAGALAVALLEGRDPLEAAAFAVAASTLAVTGRGSQEAYPERHQVEALLPGIMEGARGLGRC